MGKFDIRPFSVSLAPRIAEIEAQCFHANAWSAYAVLDAAAREDFIILCAFEGEKCIGYADAFFVLDELDICNIAVDENYRRRGAAGELLSALIAWAAKNGISLVTLDVRISNSGARALYEGFGFVPVGERRDFYKNPRENAIIYEKTLGSEK